MKLFATTPTLPLWYDVDTLVRVTVGHDLPHPRTDRGWRKKLSDAFPRKKMPGKKNRIAWHVSALPADIQSALGFVQPGTSRNQPDLFSKPEILVPLVRRRGRPKNSSHVSADPEKAGMIIAQLEATPEISIKIIHERLIAKLGAERAGKLRTIQWWVKNYKTQEAASLALITQPKAWKNKYMAAVGSRSEHVTHANQLWEIDSTPTDIMIGGRRYNLVVVIDVYTRRVMVLLSRTSNSRAIAELLRRAIRAWGRPYCVKMDNGKDYRSEHIQRGLTALGILVHFCTPFHPQEKPHVERANHYIQHDLMPGLPGYVGHSVAVRKEIDERSGRSRTYDELVTALDVPQFEEFMIKWAIAHNATHEHSALLKYGFGKITPEQMAQRCPSPKLIVAEDALHLFLEPVGGLKTVNGKYHIKHEHGLYSATELVGRAQARVRVRVSDYDAGNLFVFDADDDSFICAAVDPEKAGISRVEHAARIRAAERAWRGDTTRNARARDEQYRPREISYDVLNHRLAKVQENADSTNIVAFPKREKTTDTPAIQSLGNAHKDRNRQQDQMSALDRRLNGAKRFYGLCLAALVDESGDHDFNLLSDDQWADVSRLALDPALSSLIDNLKNNGEVPRQWHLPAILQSMKRRTA
jgi:putative transposase